VTVRLLYFASFREHAGRAEETRHLLDGATLSDLWRILGTEVPHFAAFGAMPPAAVNLEYAPSDRTLVEGDEVTFLPPVAGG
jgi:sulfur-carrier protein